MDNIELDNLGYRPVEEEEAGEEETNTDWRDESFVIIGAVREGLDEEKSSVLLKEVIQKIRKIFLKNYLSILTRVMDHLQKHSLKI